jgi:hypothetical protein
MAGKIPGQVDCSMCCVLNRFEYLDTTRYAPFGPASCQEPPLYPKYNPAFAEALNRRRVMASCRAIAGPALFSGWPEASVSPAKPLCLYLLSSHQIGARPSAVEMMRRDCTNHTEHPFTAMMAVSAA